MHSLARRIAAGNSTAGQQQQPCQEQLADGGLELRVQPDMLDPPMQQHVYSHECHFDLANNGSYPSRQHLHAALWQDLAASHSAAEQAAGPVQAGQAQGAAAVAAAAEADAAQAAPFSWVPEEQHSDAAAATAVQRVRPRTAQIRSKTATSLPLEYFDSPEMEQADLQQLLFEAQVAGAAGLQGLSRFYDPQGAFIWAACMVLQYDRCDRALDAGAAASVACCYKHKQVSINRNRSSSGSASIMQQPQSQQRHPGLMLAMVVTTMASCNCMLLLQGQGAVLDPVAVKWQDQVGEEAELNTHR